jgi:hypothetical protein
VAVITSNHASQTRSTAVTTDATGTAVLRRQAAQPTAAKLTSSIASKPTHAASQWPTTYRGGSCADSANIHPDRAAQVTTAAAMNHRRRGNCPVGGCVSVDSAARRRARLSRSRPLSARSSSSVNTTGTGTLPPSVGQLRPDP